MKNPLARLAVVVVFLSLGVASGQNGSGYPPSMPGAKVETYKTIGDVPMKLWIFSPQGHTASDRSPAIVFFFGGGWRAGTPQQFREQCLYFASRGMVAISADYRVASRHGVKAVICVEDGKSAIRWVRANAARLGIDPNRIAAGGGSAGGHVAAAVATIREFDAAGDPSVSCVPNALVLFNPATVLAAIPGNKGWDAKRLASLARRTGVEPERLSPYHHIRKGTPPTIIFHGRADTTVPYSTAEAFCEKMREVGNRCELDGYEGATHGFFNYGRGDGTAYYDTLRRADLFLASLGWLKGPPTIRGAGATAGVADR